MHYVLFFYGNGVPRDLHSFPTRRSSDLSARPGAARSGYPTSRRKTATPRSATIRARPRASPARNTRRPRSAGTEARIRSEEHTSELQSQSNLVCRLLLEKENEFVQAAQA